MYLYWRVQQDLNCLEESLCFHDPGIIRNFLKWFKKNARAIALADTM